MAEQKPLIALGTHPNYEGLSELPDGDTLEGVVNLSAFGNHSIVRSDGAGDVSALAVSPFSVLTRASGSVGIDSTVIGTNSFLGRGGTVTSPVTSVSVGQQSIVGRTSSALSTLMASPNTYLGRGTGDLGFVDVPETTILGRNTGGIFQPLDIGTVQTMLGISSGQVPTSLGSLSDVTLQAPAPGESLIYTSNNGGQWENLTLTVPDVLDDGSGGGLGPGDEGTVVYFDGTNWIAQQFTVADISDVTTGGTIANNSVLWYENGASAWEDRVLELTLLDDVSSVSTEEYQVLTYSGTAWTSDFINFQFLNTFLGFTDGGAGTPNEAPSLGDVLVFTTVVGDPNADDGDYWVSQPNTIANLLDVTVAAPYSGPDTEILSRSATGNWLVQNIDFSFLDQLEAGPPLDGEIIIRSGPDWDYTPLTLENLGDTSILTTPQNGEFLRWDTSIGGGAWTADAVNLSFVGDLDLDGPALGDVLIYNNDGGTDRWRDVPLTLGLLSDVNPDAISAAANQILLRQPGGSWVNANINVAFLSTVDPNANNANAGHILKADGGSWLSVPHTLNEISNVSASSPADNAILRYNNLTGDWEAEVLTEGATSLNDLNDVNTNLAGVSDKTGYTLRYDDSIDRWDGGFLQFSDLGNVSNVASVPADDNTYYLYYDRGSSSWDKTTINLTALNDIVDTGPTGGELLVYQNEDIGQGLDEGWVFRTLTANDIDYSLNDLVGVTVNSVANNQVLVHNGNNWLNSTLVLNQLSDVDTSGAVAGEVLTFNGDWSPQRNKAVLNVASVQSAGFTAAIDTLYPLNSTGGPFNIDVPTSPPPSIGDKLAFSDAYATASTNNITIRFSTVVSQPLHAQADDFVMTVDADYVEFTYIDATLGWIITS